MLANSVKLPEIPVPQPKEQEPSNSAYKDDNADFRQAMADSERQQRQRQTQEANNMAARKREAADRESVAQKQAAESKLSQTSPAQSEQATKPEQEAKSDTADNQHKDSRNEATEPQSSVKTESKTSEPKIDETTGSSEQEDGKLTVEQMAKAALAQFELFEQELDSGTDKDEAKLDADDGEELKGQQPVLTFESKPIATDSDDNVGAEPKDEKVVEQTDQQSSDKNTKQWLDTVIQIVQSNKESQQPDTDTELLAESEGTDEKGVSAVQLNLAGIEQKVVASEQENSDEQQIKPEQKQQEPSITLASLLGQTKQIDESANKSEPAESESAGKQDKTQQVQRWMDLLTQQQKVVSEQATDVKSSGSEKAQQLNSFLTNLMGSNDKGVKENNNVVGLTQSQQIDAEMDMEMSAQTPAKLSQSLNNDLSALTSLLNGNQVGEKTPMDELVARPKMVEVAGVEIDRTLQNAKLDNISQNRSESVIRENILFNRQELANHVNQQVGLMLAKNMKSVDIRLDPPELGSMQIKLAVNNDQAAVSFVVNSQQAKDALENSLPKLKELLEQQGMQLADSDVKQQNGGSSAEGDDSGDELASGGDNGVEAEFEMTPEQVLQVNSPWTVDYFA